MINDETVIRWDVMKSPLGLVFVAASDRGLCGVSVGAAYREFARHYSRQARLEKSQQAVAHIVEQLGQYFAASRSSFDLALDLSALTPFQRAVLDATGRIAAGRIWTYGQLASVIGRPHSSRAVGQALARNPVPIVIPCHRVISSAGALRGYSGGRGIDTKRWLLEFEGAWSCAATAAQGSP